MRGAHRHLQTPDAGAPVEILRYRSFLSESDEARSAPISSPSHFFGLFLYHPERSEGSRASARKGTQKSSAKFGPRKRAA